MVDSGFVTIGTHSYDIHYLDSTVKPVFAFDQQINAFLEDLQRSIDVLEAKLDVSITSFAYSFGVAYSHIKSVLKDSKVDYAFILHAEPITTAEPNMTINRIMVTDKTFEKQVLPWI